MLANDNDAVSSSSKDVVVVVVVVVDIPPVASQDNNTEAVEFNMTSFTRRARRHDGVKRLPSPSVVLAARAAGILLLEAEGDSIFIAITQHHLPLLCMQRACSFVILTSVRRPSYRTTDREFVEITTAAQSTTDMVYVEWFISWSSVRPRCDARVELKW